MGKHFCPEYEEAVQSEVRDRVDALAGKPESIAGIPVNSLTPRLWDILSANRSPYATGGPVTFAAVEQFMCIVSTDFSPDTSAQAWIDAHALQLEHADAARDIEAYIDRAFMDASEGKPSVPYYPLSVSLVFQMAKPPYLWPEEKTLDTPFRKIFLLLRPLQQENGMPLINKRSDAVMQQAVDEIDRKIKSGEWSQKDLDRINRDNVKEATSGG